MWRKREYDPPYSSVLATTRSPAAAAVVTTVWMAAMPLANEKAASVSSRSAISVPNARSVGLPYPRV